MTLLAWTERYLRHRDLFERQIASLTPEAEGFLITQKDGSVRRCVVKETLNENLITGVKDEVLVVTRNRRVNLDWVLHHWDALAELPGLRIVFVNLTKDEKWVLVPALHARVAEPESLARGLTALFGTVPEG